MANTTEHIFIIEHLTTKLFYQNDQLFFQILLNYDNNQKMTFGEYTDYTSYKKDHNQLLGLKASGEPVSISSIRSKSSCSLIS